MGATVENCFMNETDRKEQWRIYEVAEVAWQPGPWARGAPSEFSKMMYQSAEILTFEIYFFLCKIHVKNVYLFVFLCNYFLCFNVLIQLFVDV